ncbi:GlcG/HbpS family heme-binding protein [Pseudomonas chlororaphis]|uniref:GlcG/HbpS family heme-binding protein n=1 Tax=Pseudomonas chlororaphis TaxID=587753 RepID=UPI001F14A05A|nr:heme-binding protein [Pseudomonas chlororaphis]
MNFIPELTLQDAKRVAAAATAYATERGWTVVVAIVDAGGHTLYLERADGTQRASSVIAEEKARTAILFKRPSKAIQDMVLNGRIMMMQLPGVTPVEGGVPLIVDGHYVGAIGVSGFCHPRMVRSQPRALKHFNLFMHRYGPAPRSDFWS